ncbi:MAG TPA: hypothetical protein VK361_03425 [Rubrobacteraceae bacterium]|nr:hypothetical protein [Rubrobacteraceae bacterium]
MPEGKRREQNSRRTLSSAPGLPPARSGAPAAKRVREQRLEGFGSLGNLVKATEEELIRVKGAGRAHARTIQRNVERSRALRLPLEFV